MNTSRHHADWLSLVEVSGPFISLPVLLRVFPQGLEARDPAQAKALRAAYDEWQANPAAPGLRRAWILHVLTNLLGYPADLLAEGQTLPAGLEANIAQMGETLRPDFALVGPKNTETAGQAHLLIAAYPSSQKLDRPLADRHWKASPATRMMELLHVSGVPLGLLTNGEHWMLVYAPRGETTGYASWYGALWLDEPITLRAFHSLLGVRRFFGVDAPNTLLGLLKESASDQQEVTDQLGYQVREAVQVLVQAFDMLDQDANRTLLNGLKETDLYDSALTVMMRLVFLFSAEERGLLHLGKPLYDDNYAVSTLMEQLQEVADLHGPQVLERRCDAWARLLATFRAVHGGVHHQDLMMPAYGGSLFDPDRYPFLEGRAAGTKWVTTPAELLNINNRVVLHLLSSLQRLRMKVPGGGPSESRRISFRALGVEQIGHVYEGLLDHTAVRATEPVLGIRGTRGKDAEISLAKLETILAKGQEALVEFLHDETGRTEKAIKRALDEGTPNEEHRLLIACGHDASLLQRVRLFAGLVREDSFERPMVVLPGSVYVTAGTTRRSTGTHYTPPSLTEPIVQHTLEPLVFRGPSEGLPQGEWQLKSPKEILGLKVCDMAMGSGAFLVQACRYLSERLAESWENEEKKHPNEFLITPEGGFSAGAPSERLIPADATERLAIARRIVADRCLYGVDINQMAVEMAKLSMWLITLDAKRPFTFLDHAFKCGDSLLGLSSFKQLEDFSLRPGGVKQVAFSTMNLWRHVEEAKRKRELLETMPSDTPEQVTAKAALYAEAEEAVIKLRSAADILVATELKELKGRKYEEDLESAADRLMFYWSKGADQLRDFANGEIRSRRTFHWPLAFPEIIESGGFNAFVGNPPFLGGKRLCEVLGDDYNNFLKVTFEKSKGAADLCAYFFRRAEMLLSAHATAGFLATNSIAQGDTREVGLDYLTEHRCVLLNAISTMPWPGLAGVAVSRVIWSSKWDWKGLCELDGKPVEYISSHLEATSHTGTPHRISIPIEKASYGTGILGIGFTLEPELASEWIKQDSKYKKILHPYINADDLNSSPKMSYSRFVIDFGDRSESEAKQFALAYDRVKVLVKPQRDRLTRQIHETCWWKHWDRRTELYAEAGKFQEVLLVPLVTKYLSFVFAPFGWVYSKELGVIPTDRRDLFACYQSTFHDAWARRNSSTLETRLAYSFSDALRSFAVPQHLLSEIDRTLAGIGNAYECQRREICASRSEGLTKTYNRFHNRSESAADIARLRTLQVDMDHSVALVYGWGDLDLDHGFHETRQGIRYTISESARLIILDRLLALNHQRHDEEKAEEMILGKQPKATSKRRRKAKVLDAHDGDTLFSEVGE
jgi:hypothetical protein